MNSIDVWENQILITDFFLNNLWTFSDKFEIIKRIGRKGKGPGEYYRSPTIITDKNKIWLHQGNFIDSYDQNLIYVKRFQLPKDLIYLSEQPIILNNTALFSIAYPASIAENSYYKEYKALIALDLKTFKYKSFEKWNKDYYDNPKLDAYTKENHSVLLGKGQKNSFYTMQRGTQIIKHYDKNLNIIKEFSFKPKYFKTPPKKTKMQVQKSVETLSEFISQITKIRKLKVDTLNNFIIINYSNMYKDFYIKRSLMHGVHYLQIFNKNYDCILDEEIPGMLAFVNNTKIYVINEEKPEYLKLYIYNLVKKNEDKK